MRPPSGCPVTEPGLCVTAQFYSAFSRNQAIARRALSRAECHAASRAAKKRKSKRPRPALRRRGGFQMKKWLKIGIGVVLAVAAGFVAHMHVVAQTYYPSLRVQAPEGLTYVVVQDERAERRECGAANERFLARIKQGCKECRILA